MRKIISGNSTYSSLNLRYFVFLMYIIHIYENRSHMRWTLGVWNSFIVKWFSVSRRFKYLFLLFSLSRFFDFFSVCFVSSFLWCSVRSLKIFAQYTEYSSIWIHMRFNSALTIQFTTIYCRLNKMSRVVRVIKNFPFFFSSPFSSTKIQIFFNYIIYSIVTATDMNHCVHCFVLSVVDVVIVLLNSMAMLVPLIHSFWSFDSQKFENTEIAWMIK